MKKPAAVTIMTVASEAGVSMKTVSRVLNNEAHVRPDTREKVMRVVKELGYQPNAAARSLAGSRNYLIGLVYDNPAQGFVGSVQAGAMAACQNAGFALLPQQLKNGQTSTAPAFMERMSRRGLDGLIITAPLMTRRAMMSVFDESGIPYVFLGSGIGSDKARAVIKIDNRLAMRAVAKHLIERGHRKIAVVMGPPDHRSSSSRLDGLLGAMLEAGITIPEHWRAPGDFTYLSGLKAGELLIDRAERPTAIVCLNDDMAAGVVTVAHKHGVSIPRDLSVTGFDDSPFATLLWPALTTIRQPLEDMASVAVNELLSRLSNEQGPCETIRIDFDLMERESTGPCTL